MLEKRLKQKEQKTITVETIAIKKMRELKGLSRKEAGALLGVSYKQIEKTENGRVHLSQERIAQFIKSYGYTFSDFELICEGKADLVEEKIVTNSPQKKKQIIRRIYKKIITKEVLALISLRKKKDVSQYEASSLCGYSKTAIGHIEHGRIELRRSRIEHIVESYGFTMEDFEKEVKSELRYNELLESCLYLIKRLDDNRLLTVHQLLKSFSL